MDNSQFCRLAQLCFGKRWLSDAQEELGVSRRHLQRIAAGQNSVSPGIAADILTVSKQRITEFTEIVNQEEGKMRQFSLMRRLQKNYFVKDDFYESENKDHDYGQYNWTGRGLIDCLNELETRKTTIVRGYRDSEDGVEYDYWLESDGQRILDTEPLLELLEFYLEIRGTQDADFVRSWARREVASW